MKPFTLLVGLAALAVAGCAAFFSVTGLALLFSGASLAVMVMGTSLEIAKLVSVVLSTSILGYYQQIFKNIPTFRCSYISYNHICWYIWVFIQRISINIVKK
jgi:hypothetical protein